MKNGTKDIFNTLLGLNRESTSAVLELFQILNKPFRRGATSWNPNFYLSNVLADTQQAFVYSDKTFIPVVDTMKGIIDYTAASNETAGKIAQKFNEEFYDKKNQMLQLYKQSGASSATRMSQERKSVQKIMKQVYGTKDSETLGIKNRFKKVKQIAEILDTAGDISEQSTRFEVFQKNYQEYINKGWTEADARLQAALESRDATQDFSRMGSFMKEINKIIPFSAARVGSLLTFKEKVKAHPGRTAMRIALLMLFSQVIQSLGDDDDEISEINQRKKRDYYIFRLGNNIITLKKPQGILKSWINLGETLHDIVIGKIETEKILSAFYDWAMSTLQDASVSDDITGIIPSFATPLAENLLNKDFYYKNDIVKNYDLDLPNEQQYYDYNSQLAISLGQIFSYSPAKIDNLISGWFGGLGTELTNIGDYISGKLGLSTEEPAMGAEDMTVLKRFVINPNENSASIDEVYTLKDELTKKLNGGTITSEENKQLETLKQATSDMAALNKQIKAIKKDLTMSGTEKADKIKPLQEQKTDVARKALGKDPIYTTRTSDLDSLQFYPSRDVLSKNNYTLSLTEEMKKEYEKLAYSQYQKYKKQGIYSEEYLDKLKSKCKDYAKSKMMQKYKNKLTKSK